MAEQAATKRAKHYRETHSLKLYTNQLDLAHECPLKTKKPTELQKYKIEKYGSQTCQRLYPYTPIHISAN
jgi:hypothetical protein